MQQRDAIFSEYVCWIKVRRQLPKNGIGAENQHPQTKVDYRFTELIVNVDAIFAITAKVNTYLQNAVDG